MLEKKMVTAVLSIFHFTRSIKFSGVQVDLSGFKMRDDDEETDDHLERGVADIQVN
jgi:hypothetical protein